MTTGFDKVYRGEAQGHGCPFCPRIYKHIGWLLNHVQAKHPEGHGWLVAQWDELSRWSKPGD